MEQALNRWKRLWFEQTRAPRGVHYFLPQFLVVSLGLAFLEAVTLAFHPGNEYVGIIICSFWIPASLFILFLWQNGRVLAAFNFGILLIGVMGIIEFLFFPLQTYLGFHFLLIGAITFVISLELGKFRTGLFWVKAFALLFLAYSIHSYFSGFWGPTVSYTFIHKVFPAVNTFVYFLLFGNFFIPYFKKKVKSQSQLHSDILKQRKLHQEALQEQKDLANMRMQFVATTSHQFKTPLTVISTSTFLLRQHLKKGSPKEQLNPFLNRIEKETVRLTKLMENVLILGKESTNTHPLEFQNLDLEDLIQTLLKDISADYSIELQVVGTPFSIRSEKYLLEHIMINLISNAIKYSEKGIPPIVKILFSSNEYAIEVIDFGIGIPDKDKPFLFQSFYRGSNVQNITGTGLGLVIAKQLTEKLGGSIQIESKENKGTTVTLRWPGK